MPPSSHSHSSHSSSSCSSRSSSSRSSSSGSSSRSTSSHSSSRIRTNQPSGYTGKTSVKRCRYHDYAYYSTGWMDNNTGKYYDAGYYDENGNYYKGLTVKSNGKYTSEFVCDYCGTLGRYTWDEGAIPNCENCGAPLSIVNSFAQDEEGADYSSSGSPDKLTRLMSILITSIVVIIIATVGIINFAHIKDRNNTYSASEDTSSDMDASNIDLYGEEIYLVSNGDGSYSLGGTADSYDKYLFYDYENHTYYDIDSDAYLWFNTDVEPALWQYWYEGYSSKYGDYGWMEHDDEGWWVEAKHGDWQAADTEETANFWWIR